MKHEEPFLKHILDEISFLLKETNGLRFEEFMQNEVLKRACSRSLEIIGEASRSIPEELRNQYKDIPWKRMAGMRDKLIHGYFGVDYESVWAVATERISEIKHPLEKMIKEQSGK